MVDFTQTIEFDIYSKVPVWKGYYVLILTWERHEW